MSASFSDYHLPGDFPACLVSCNGFETYKTNTNCNYSFLVAIPAISQMVVNKSDLVLVNASVLNPRPDKIQLTLLSALDLKIALPVRIEPITLDLFVRDAGAGNAWGQANIDGKVIKGNTTLGVTKIETPLTNLTTWDEYVHNVVFEKETALSVRGVTNSYLGVLKSKVTMDKDIMSPGKPKKTNPYP